MNDPAYAIAVRDSHISRAGAVRRPGGDGDMGLRDELRIQATAPSPNSYVRTHWTVYQKIKKHGSPLVLEAMQSCEKAFPPLRRARVHIMRYGERPLDPDNLHGAQKPLIDALRAHGFIEDDSSEHIELHVGQGKRPKGTQPCTLVEIVPCPGK